MKNYIILFIIMQSATFTFDSAFAETIMLKSGEVIEGKIIEKKDDAITVDFEGVPITYFYEDIDNIDGVKATGSPVTIEEYLVKKGIMRDINADKPLSLDDATIKEIYDKFGFEKASRFLSSTRTELSSKIYENATWGRDYFQQVEKLAKDMDPIEGNENVAMAGLKHIFFSWYVFYIENKVSPKNLSELIQFKPGCLSEIFDDTGGNPKVSGYEFIYSSSTDNSFRVIAKPINEGITGNKYFMIDESGQLKESLTPID